MENFRKRKKKKKKDKDSGSRESRGRISSKLLSERRSEKRRRSKSPEFRVPKKKSRHNRDKGGWGAVTKKDVSRHRGKSRNKGAGHDEWDNDTSHGVLVGRKSRSRTPALASEWDMPSPSYKPDGVSTPLLTPRNRITGRSINRGLFNNSSVDSKIDVSFKREWKSEEDRIDRAWYQNEGAQDVDDVQFLGKPDSFVSRRTARHKTSREKTREEKKREQEEAAAATQSGGDKKKKPWENLPSERRIDGERFEEQMMVRAGVAKYKAVDTDFSQEVQFRVNLIVRSIHPPFLDGREVFTKQLDPVSVVKDETSDLAVVARKGSEVLKKYKENKDRFRATKRFWEVKGTKTGDLLGEEREAEKFDEGDKSYDHRKSNKYADHIDIEQKAVSEFARTKTLAEQRRYLPIYSIRSNLMRDIQDHQIIVLVGETGSGKTTQITQYMLEEGYAKNGIIVCTQPRRVAAMSVAKRVADERKCVLGSEVGYTIRFEDCTSPETKIKYCTDGVLLREALNKNALDRYSVIIMDEAHERSLHTDILFGVLKDVVKSRYDLKLIVTSATLDAGKFCRFFGDCPEFSIPGRTFEVDEHFSKTPVEDYVDAAVKTIIQIHLHYGPGDILIFMTGQLDIMAVCHLAADRLKEYENREPLTILPMYSQLPSDLQAKIFKQTEDGSRKCVVATNIAETSLTVDGIKYVVDCGYCKLKVYQPRIGMDSLKVTPVSRANARQRSGRAGRTEPGVCFRLYTHLQFNTEMLEMTVPEIQRANLGNVVLLLKNLGVDDLLTFEFMDPPPQETMVASMYQLWMLGALNNTGGVTELGLQMVQFPLDPPLSKMLIYSNTLNCSSEIMTIVAVLSVPNIFFRPDGRAEESDAMREKFMVPESDHLTLLNCYLQWERHSYSGDWCRKHFVNLKSMRKVREVRAQIEEIMQAERMPVKSCGDEWDVVRKAIASAYFNNACKIKGFCEYTSMRKGISAHLHPSSAMFGSGYNPDYVIYHELIMTSKEYMRNVTAVDPLWLAELAPMFFDIKQNKEGRKYQEQLQKRIMEEEQQNKYDEENARKKKQRERKIQSARNAEYVGVATLKEMKATKRKKRRRGI